MKSNNKVTQEQAQTITKYLQEIVQQIKTHKNPELLDEYKKLLKKNVPIFLRSYFAAYLLKQSLSATGVEEAASTDAEQKYTKLFIGVGKSRRVFPRDLIQLFSQHLDLEKAEIGKIRIFDNYSFLEITSTRASEAISQLSGIDYKGKKLVVNIARKRDQQ